MSALRIVIGAGGTAGHVVPALAVADALAAQGAQVHFIGGERLESTLVPQAGYELHKVSVVTVPRRPSPAALRAMASDTRAVSQAIKLVRALEPGAVYGGGGYASLPAGLAAARLRVPLVIGEIDSRLGLANRVLAPFARRVCATPVLAGHYSNKFNVTGRPVPALSSDRRAARARFQIPRDAVCVLVFGGSQGARSINHAALGAFAAPRIGAAGRRKGVKIHVLHAAGERDLAALTAPGEHYDLRGYIDNFMEALVAADLVVARSGGSIWEIAAAGRASVLIPYPHATADHQTPNAQYFVAAGAAVMIPDVELSIARLAQEVTALLQTPGRLEEMGSAALKLARPNAARDIADEILAAAAARS